jgi:hypothetical protein
VRRSLVLATTTAGLAAAFCVSAPPASADVPAHQHWLTTPGGVVPVGPPVCENPDIYAPWLSFHVNVHRGTPGTTAFTNASNPVSISATGC